MVPREVVMLPTRGVESEERGESPKILLYDDEVYLSPKLMMALSRRHKLSLKEP